MIPTHLSSHGHSATLPLACPCRRVSLFYHQQAMTWGWYMLEPWETLLWMAMLVFFFWLVASACFLNPSSMCSTTLAAARKAIAEQGALLAQHSTTSGQAGIVGRPGWHPPPDSCHCAPAKTGSARLLLRCLPRLIPQAPGCWRSYGDAGSSKAWWQQRLAVPLWTVC